MQLVLACADPYSVYTIKPSTILLYNAQIIFLLLGVYVFYRKVDEDYYVDYNRELIFNITPNKLLLSIQTVFLMLTIYKFGKMRTYLMSMEGLTNDAREYYFSELFGSYTEVMINEIVCAFGIVSYFILFSLFFFHEGKLSISKLYLAISSLLIVVLTSLTTMGRFEIMELVITFLFFLFYGLTIDDNRVKKKIVSFGIVIVSMMVFVVVAVTMFRQNLMSDDSDSFDALLESFSYMIVEPFCTYFYVPILAFDYGQDYLFNSISPLYGGADFASIIDIFLLPFTFLIHDLPTCNSVLGEVMTPAFFFPCGKIWNALFTGAANYYIDFGFMGFIIFPFALGYFFSYLSIKAQDNASWFIVFMFIFIALYKAVFSSGIQSMSVVFTMMWIFVLKRYYSIS